MQLAIGYPRTSKEKDDAFSIKTQHDRILEYAARHDLVVPPDMMLSETHTGAVIDRPQLNKLRQFVREGEARDVIVYSCDRLSRSTGVGETLLDELFSLHVTLHIVQWDSSIRDTPEDRLRFEMEMMFSSLERRKIRERTARGKLGKVSQGIFLGGGYVLYGYRVTGSKRDTKLVIDEAESAVVLLIFTLYASGIGVSEIARRLQREGYVSPGESKGLSILIRPAGEWSTISIYKLLNDRSYTGEYSYYRGTNAPVIVQIPPIVSQELWQAVQDRLAQGRQQSIRNAKYPYLLSRRLVCGRCGRTIQTNARPHLHYTTLYYRCASTTSRDAHPSCKSPYFNADKVDRAGWDLLSGLVREPGTLKARLMQSRAESEARNSELRASLQRLDNQIAKQRNRLEGLIDLAADAYVDATPEHRAILRETFRQRTAAVEATLSELAEERKKVVGQLEPREISEDYIAGWERLRDEIGDKLDAATPAQRRELVEDRNLRGTLTVEDGKRVVYFDLYGHKFRYEVE